MITALLLSVLAAPVQDLPYTTHRQLGGDAFLQTSTVDYIALDPSGARIASCASGGELVLWDAQTGAALARTNLDLQRAVALDFLGSDKLLVGDLEDRITLVGIEPGALVELDPFEHGLGDLVDVGGGFALSPDETRLAIWKVTGYSGDLMLASVDPAEQPRVRLAKTISDFRIDEVVWRSDSSELAVVSTNGRKALGRAGTEDQAASHVHIMERSGAPKTTFDSPTVFVLGLEYGPHEGDDGVFVAGSRTGMFLFDRVDGRQIMQLGELDTIVGIDVSDDGRKLFATDLVGQLEEWELSLDAAPELLRSERLARPVTMLRYAGDEHIVGCQGRRVRRWDADSFELEPNVLGHTGQLVSLELIGAHLFSASMDGAVVVRNLETGVERGVETRHDGLVFGMSLAPEADLVASCGQDGSVRVWALGGEQHGELVAQYEGRGQAAFTDVAFSPRGDVLTAISADGILWIWERESGQLLRTFEGLKGLKFQLEFSADGSRLAMGSTSLRVWNTADWSLAGYVDSLGAPVTALAFGADPAVVGVGLANRRVLLLDAASGEVLETSQLLKGRVSGLTFTDSGLAATSSMEGGIQLFTKDLEPAGFLPSARKTPAAALSGGAGRLISGDVAGRIDVWE